MLAVTARPAAVAGAFYPANAVELSATVQALLDAAPHRPDAPLKALIVPHAGYIYSGAIAASAYQQLQPLRCKLERVILLGPAHRVPVRGVALPGVEAFSTPLGEVPLDLELCARLSKLPQVLTSVAAHAQEHSLEVQLPFLQIMLGAFKLVPLVVGDVSPEAVAQVLETVWGGDETLIVISSDLSHYLKYEEAQAKDRVCCQRIAALDGRISPHEACGAAPIAGLLLAARRVGLEAELLDMRNSGDTAGDKARVVGYASFAFRPHPAPDEAREAELGRQLLCIARAAIAERLGEPAPALPDLSALHVEAACFVTLTIDGFLRGCIGSLHAHRPLLEDLRSNAMAAAFNDPRFLPLRQDEWPHLKLEVSLLSPCTPISFANEADALARLRPYVDGIILEHGSRRATYLPQVWKQLPEPQQFIGQLKLKAGLPLDFWSPAIKLSRYTVRHWQE